MCGDYITTTVYEPIDDSDFDAYLINEGFRKLLGTIKRITCYASKLEI